MRIALSSAHGKLIRGAKSIIDEVDESRRVVEQVADDLRTLGAEVMVFHDNVSRTQAANLKAINAWHNRQNRQLDVSIHFNAYIKTVDPRGVEVLYRKPQAQALAAKVSSAIAAASGMIDRGAKRRTNLSFLNSTSSPRAILVEIAFVDSRADVDLYKKHFQKICKVIAVSLI